MVRHEDVEMTVMREEDFAHSFPRNRRHRVPCRATPGETLELGRRQREWGEIVGKSLYCDFPGKERVKQSKQD